MKRPEIISIAWQIVIITQSPQFQTIDSQSHLLHKIAQNRTSSSYQSGGVQFSGLFTIRIGGSNIYVYMYIYWWAERQQPRGVKHMCDVMCVIITINRLRSLHKIRRASSSRRFSYIYAKCKKCLGSRCND